VSSGEPNRKPIRRRILPAVLRRLQKTGVEITPFLTVLEGQNDGDLPAPESEFRFGFVPEQEISSLAQLDKNQSSEKIQRWLSEGKRCYGAWDGPRLAAKMWCDFAEYNFPPNRRKLEGDEVYLFAAYSHPDYRGQGLAPNLRLQAYRALRELGHSRFYSYTDYFNDPARRFKEKLNARNDELKLHVCLFGGWSRVFTLKKY